VRKWVFSLPVDIRVLLNCRRLSATIVCTLLLVQLSVSSSATAASPIHPFNGPTVFGPSGWEIVPIALPADNDLALACVTSSVCVAAGDNANNGSDFIKTTDGGITWTHVASYSYGVGSLSCVSTGFCMAAPYGGDRHLVVSTDGGETWATIAQPPFVPSTLRASGEACSRSFCIVIGGDSNGNIPVHGVEGFVTSDRGTTWTPTELPAPMKDLQALSCSPTGKCYMVYDTYTNKFSDMAFSVNRGRSWIPITRARGFTSLGGFSCPSSRSCVYLATQVLEVSSGSSPTWTDFLGPFSRKQNGSVSAFALSCTAVSRCMIGGSLGRQAVVWIEAPAWGDRRVSAALQKLTTRLDGSYGAAFAELGRPASAVAFAVNLNLLETGAQANLASIEALALHARGHQQTLVDSIGSGWRTLLGGLDQTGTDLNLHEATAQDAQQLVSDLKSITQAERHAGVRVR
jgi:hypothetical protein